MKRSAFATTAALRSSTARQCFTRGRELKNKSAFRNGCWMRSSESPRHEILHPRPVSGDGDRGPGRGLVGGKAISCFASTSLRGARQDDFGVFDFAQLFS